MALVLLRKILTSASYSVDSVGRMWKEFSAYLTTRSLRLRTREKPTLSTNNIFRFLLKTDFVTKLVGGITCKAEATYVAHLSSTRNLPAAGDKTILKSLNSFKECVTSEFQSNSNYLDRLKITSAKVARKILRINPKSLDKVKDCHISLSRAGDFDSPVKQGGRANIVIEELTKILDYTPSTDECLTLPDGTDLKTPAGVARWKSWFREPDFIDDFRSKGVFNTPIVELGTWMPSPSGEPEFVPENRYGIDMAIGPQMLAAALICASNEGYVSGTDVVKPIPTRTAVVPEPGVKARTVSTTKWWVIVLEQPLGNLIRAILKDHPSAEAGLIRADQAWLYCDMLSKVARKGGFKKLAHNFYILSSDLQEATDRTPHCVARALLEGFCEGIGLNCYLADLAINLICSSREVHVKHGNLKDQFITCRGVLMGEPMTKAILTLQSLVAEEMAIRDFLEIPDGPINEPWRCFSVGGDDHIAHGPLKYLNNITLHQENMGSKIQYSKHGVSRTAVKYCEKVIYLKDSDLSCSASEVNSLDGYDKAAFVDSIKVRLLSPISKSIEIKNDRNIAIGKAKSLGKTLRWLNVKHFPLKWVQMVRNRFVLRMKGYLPAIGTSLFSQICLPTELGGLDIYIEGELPMVILSSPLPTLKLVCDLVNGQADPVKLAKLKRFPSNNVSRGTTLHKAVMDLTEALLFDYCLKSVEELKEEMGILDTVSNREVFSKAKSIGYVSIEEAVDMASRSLIFSQLLTKESTSSSFNTTPWKKRYYDLWSEIYSEEDCNKNYPSNTLSVIEETKFYKNFFPVRLINLNKEVNIWARDESGRPMPPEFDVLTIREALEENHPCLKVGLNSYLPDVTSCKPLRPTRKYVTNVINYEDTFENPLYGLWDFPEEAEASEEEKEPTTVSKKRKLDSISLPSHPMVLRSNTIRKSRRLQKLQPEFSFLPS
uniref:RNA-dependent RNA polymerase n=1 Tax=Bremia lactucae associated narnavirus 2 TaxID=2719803 RepID=A0A6G9ELE4_9VIRU|nr:MAG: RNA-dependent RNA polymerase [Bremia lactucae associated narnavirus 2]